MVKLQENGGQFFITIPREYVLEKGWKKHQDICIGFDAQGNLVLKAVKEKKG
jgi:hypothetical protein